MILIIKAHAENWVTINGVHVLIGANGKITKGPAKFIGSTLDDLPKSASDRKADLKKKYGDKSSSKESNKSEDSKGGSSNKDSSKKDEKTKSVKNSDKSTKPNNDSKSDPNKKGTVSYNGKEYSYEVKGNHLIMRSPEGSIISDGYIADRHLGNVKEFASKSFGPTAKTSNLSDERLLQETADLLEGVKRGDATARRQSSYYFEELANRSIRITSIERRGNQVKVNTSNPNNSSTNTGNSTFDSAVAKSQGAKSVSPLANHYNKYSNVGKVKGRTTK